MTKVRFNQPSRAGNPVKTQFRARGRVHLEDLEPEVAQEIGRLREAMEARIARQEADMLAGLAPGDRIPPPNWLLEEDELLQLLRLQGMGYAQIERVSTFLPR